MEMDNQAIIISQYRASLKMLEQVIDKCPDSLWTCESKGNLFWHIAYHAIFYTHLYLSASEKEFVPWDKHKEGYEFLGTYPWPPYDKPEIGEAYSKDDIIEYLQFCDKEVARQVNQLNLRSESGFSWIPMNKMELQLYNIRHLQQHVGELCERLWASEQIEIDWVGMLPLES